MNSSSRLWIGFALSSYALAGAYEGIPPMPMQPPPEEHPNYRALRKPVRDSRLLDDMEDPTVWSAHGPGEMSFTRERSRDGGQSLRLRTPTRFGNVPPSQRSYGHATVVRRFPKEDWNRFNRVSLWVYPDLPGFRSVSIVLRVTNEGAPASPYVPGRFPVIEDRCYISVRNQDWNQVTWEIPHVVRDNVVSFSIGYPLDGNEPEATGVAVFDFDRLELERVEADPYEGWNIAPGRIAFNHLGYTLNGPKQALVGDPAVKGFRVVHRDTGQVALEKPAQPLKTRLGEYQLLDFGEVRRPGEYLLEVGSSVTQPFRIVANPWVECIWKAINFFYCQRCGFDVPGIHRVCHRDWRSIHRGKSVVINGGWHDAGDLSQGLTNTAEAVYAMLRLAGGLDPASEYGPMRQRLVEEAKWGLDWVLKTSFHDGYRSTWATSSLWTNGIIGDEDDLSAAARNSPYENFTAAAAEALAASVLRVEEPGLAVYSLRMAREDWRFAAEAWKGLSSDQPTEPRRPGAPSHPIPADMRGTSQIEIASAGIVASMDLFRATGERSYADYALRLAPIVIESQQRSFLPGPRERFAGFFYTDPAKRTVLRYSHRGHEQAPVVAMARLCEAFPEHPGWIRWYSVVALHSEYWLKAGAAFSEPFGMLPSSIHREDEPLDVADADVELFRRQIREGAPLGGGYFLRLFPVWTGFFRGNFGVTLSQAAALSTAAGLRGRLDLAQLAERQLQWIVGFNPFSESAMYGAGYGYRPMFAAHSGDLVGALPVGFQTRAEKDVPYWPSAAIATYKEIWVHPVSRWLWLMGDLAGLASVTGRVDAESGGPVEFRDAKTGFRVEVVPEGGKREFRAALPAGQYSIRSGAVERTATLLPARRYSLDLRAAALDLSATQQTVAGERVTIRVHARGSGQHRLTVRAYNLDLDRTDQEVRLEHGRPRSFTWAGRVIAGGAPWVVVVLPDGDFSARLELIGPP